MSKLSPRRLKVYTALLAGKSEKEALVIGGYSASSGNIITRIKEIMNMPTKETVSLAVEQIAGEIRAEIMSKDEIVNELRSIAMRSDNERNRIAAMAQICKIMGYDAPTKVEQNTQQALLMKIEIDNSFHEASNKFPEDITCKQLTS